MATLKAKRHKKRLEILLALLLEGGNSTGEITISPTTLEAAQKRVAAGDSVVFAVDEATGAITVQIGKRQPKAKAHAPAKR